MSKFLLNLLVQISKALVYSKKSNFIQKRIFPITFGLSGLLAQSPFFTGPAHPHDPTGHLSSSSRTEAGRARRRRWPASRRLHGHPDASTVTLRPLGFSKINMQSIIF
jgi:hypothetical protein